MKHWPGMAEAVATFEVFAAAKTPREERITHFQQTYPERFGHLTSWEGIRYVLLKARRELALTDKLSEVPAAPLNYHREVPELRFPFEEHLAVLSDLHASAHDDRGVSLFLKTVETLKIPAVVVNGDTFDNAYLGHGGIRNSRSADAAENLHSAAAILNAMTRSGVERAWVIYGNHDEKPFRGTDGELLYPEWWAAKVAPLLERPECFRVTHRYYCIMDAMNPIAEGWMPEHFPTRFTHQKEYGRLPLGVASRLADKFVMNVITGHQHHLAVGRHKSRKFILADAGTLQHAEGAEYKVGRDTTHPEWTPGFLTLHHGVPKMWALDYPAQWWSEQLGLEDTDDLE